MTYLKGRVEKTCLPRILSLAKLSFSYEEETETSLGKQMPRGFIATRSALQEMLRGARRASMKDADRIHTKADSTLAGENYELELDNSSCNRMCVSRLTTV